MNIRVRFLINKRLFEVKRLIVLKIVFTSIYVYKSFFA